VGKTFDTGAYGTPEDVTAQEILNRTWRRFITRRSKQSIDDDGNCVYRSPEGRACAVGMHVTDAECRDWDRSNNSTIDAIAARGQLPRRLEAHRALLSDLQAAHDGWDSEYDGEERRRSLIEVADAHGLTVPVGAQ
jgi:hypothetical protein